MYIGGYNPRGLHHLVYEIVDNSVDEALAGYAKHVEVRINPDSSCTVTDDGRGIPVDTHPDTGLPAVEMVFDSLATGGKFGGTLIAGRLTGMRWRSAASLGILMNTRGLMELVVLNVGLDLNVISPTLYTMMVLMALVTTMATTPLLDVFGAEAFREQELRTLATGTRPI